MEDYVEDYKYNNSFWMKSGLLYSHAEKKFQEYLSVGHVFKNFSTVCQNFSEELLKIPNFYKEAEENSTLCNGIKAILEYIKTLSLIIKNLKKDVDKLAKKIFERELAYESKKGALDMCEQDHKNYKSALEKLKLNKEAYFESINKAIEMHLIGKLKGKDKKINPKILNEIEVKRAEYKAQIEKVEEIRVLYMNIQGNIFASEEEMERDCTNELKLHFDCVKKEIKNKSPAELRQLQNQISQDVTNFLSKIIKEEPNQIHDKILEIAKNLKESKCTENEFQYLITKFQERFDQFLKWKKARVGFQDFKKVGIDWDERFCYMHTFLGYFNKTRVENKELNLTNFNYLCQAISKILELNENEDIDYSLCDLVVILSSTFYTKDPNSKSGKKYVNEIIKHNSIMQRQGFWVGLTKYELNEEIQHQKKEEETLSEDNISEDKLNNSVTAKLMSVSYNIMQFIKDSNTFNRIIFDIFKYCKISNESREVVVGMMETQIEGENMTHIQLDKDYLLKGS